MALIVVTTIAIVTVLAAVTLLHEPGNVTALRILKFVAMVGLGLGIVILAVAAFLLPTSAVYEDEEPHDPEKD